MINKRQILIDSIEPNFPYNEKMRIFYLYHNYVKGIAEAMPFVALSYIYSFLGQANLL